MDKYKKIHIGKHIQHVVLKSGISLGKICQYMQSTPNEIEEMYAKSSIDSSVLLKWSKLLNYNFFMFYNTHLQLYKPKASTARLKETKESDSLYDFSRKYYSNEVKEFVLNKIKKEELTVADVISKYNIPRTTIYRWVKKGQRTVKKKVNTSLKCVNYRLLYSDLIESIDFKNENEKAGLIREANSISCYLDVRKLNNKIADLVSVSFIRLGCSKAYDLDFIKFVLMEQKKYKMSHIETANKYKINRNTISKWNKLFS